MHLPRRFLLSAVLTLGTMLATTAVAAAQPTAPPTVLLAPSGTVSEKDLLTFRIQSAADDAQSGHWGLLIESGNDEVVDLKQTSDPSVYERSFRLHNQKVFAADREDGSPDFAAPPVSSRIFPDTVTWRVAFFPDSKPSQLGDKATRTAKQQFVFKATFENRQQVHAAGLPAARSHLIVPNKSLAGIYLGDRRSRVLKLWDSPFTSDESLFERTDNWSRGKLVKGEPRLKGDGADVEYGQDDADLIEIYRPRSHPGGLGKWKTAKGIGLGSKRSKLLRAYPNIEPLESDEEDATEAFVIPGKGLTETVFGLDRKHKVNLVLMR